jgi:hypothetical protein
MAQINKTNEQMADDYQEIQAMILENNELKSMFDKLDVETAKPALKFLTLFGMAMKYSNFQK